MTDVELIDFCERHCQTPRALFAAWRINRMVALAGFPVGYPRYTHENEFCQMHASMLVLVEYARKRLARPKEGLQIQVTRVYRGVAGDMRRVVDMPPHFKSFDVIWHDLPRSSSRDHDGTARLEVFKDWAVEEVTG